MKTKYTLADRRKQFLEVSYSGRNLKYPLTQFGLWEVFGEDANCDLGGSHYQPKLGVFEGTLGEVVDIAVMLPNFWQWGGGGDIKLVQVKSTKDYNAKTLAILQLEKESIEARLKELNAILGA